MENKTNVSLGNIYLPKTGVDYYSASDGLSLQNLFISTCCGGGLFPSAHMFTQEGRSGDYFDIPALVEDIINNIKEDEANIEDKAMRPMYVRYETENLDTKELVIGWSFVFPQRGLFFRIEKNVSESYILFVNDKEDELKWLLNIIYRHYIAPEVEKGNVFTLASTSAGFALSKQSVFDVDDFDINLQYNDDFVEIDEELCDFMENKKKSGIVILHGEKGTGKSTYIRHLINEYPELKFVTIAPEMASYLSDPNFTAFMKNKLANCVMILEDCEAAIASRDDFRSNGSAVSALLNISDGLQGDELGIKFICTYNAEQENVDAALLRKGRLAVEYEFNLLSVEKTAKLIPIVKEEKLKNYNDEIVAIEKEIEEAEETLNNPDEEFEENEKKELEKDIKRSKTHIERIKKKIARIEAFEYDQKKGMSLADIYNLEDLSFEKVKPVIGF